MLLTLPKDVHDWALEGFTTAREGEERCGSRGPIVRAEGYRSNQLFNVECLVHHKSVAGGMVAVLSEVDWVTRWYKYPNPCVAGWE